MLAEEAARQPPRPMMRASVLTALHTMEPVTREIPRPGPRELLVEVVATGICGSDLAV